jgi:hypothetical protein
MPYKIASRANRQLKEHSHRKVCEVIPLSLNDLVQTIHCEKWAWKKFSSWTSLYNITENLKR